MNFKNHNDLACLDFQTQHYLSSISPDRSLGLVIHNLIIDGKFSVSNPSTVALSEYRSINRRWWTKCIIVLDRQVPPCADTRTSFAIGARHEFSECLPRVRFILPAIQITIDHRLFMLYCQGCVQMTNFHLFKKSRGLRDVCIEDTNFFIFFWGVGRGVSGNI